MSKTELEEARRGRPPGSRNRPRYPEDDNEAAPRTHTGGFGTRASKRTFKGAAMKTGGAYIGATHGSALGAAAGAVAGLVAGTPLSAVGIKKARVGLGAAGALAGAVVGTVMGGKYGWKAGSFLHSRTGQERTGTFREHIELQGGESMLINEQVQLAEEALAIDLSEEALNDLTEEVEAALVEALLPVAARFDIIDAQLAEGTITEAEAGRQKGGLLKTAAKVGAGLAAGAGLGAAGTAGYMAASGGHLGSAAKNAADAATAAVQPAMAAAGDVAKGVADKAAPHIQAATDYITKQAGKLKKVDASPNSDKVIPNAARMAMKGSLDKIS